MLLHKEIENEMFDCWSLFANKTYQTEKEYTSKNTTNLY